MTAQSDLERLLSDADKLAAEIVARDHMFAVELVRCVVRRLPPADAAMLVKPSTKRTAGADGKPLVVFDPKVLIG